ncbi:MAG: glycosyltransferase family 4 protein [Chloroflexi bacterium]|nr:glycosyltransferase family 4 protein [Chloroflexota bacterium]
MRITIISASYPPLRSGGSETTRRLAELLAARGHAVTVITTAGLGEDRPPAADVGAPPVPHSSPITHHSSLVDRPPDAGVRVLPVARTWSIGDTWRLLRALRRSRPDVVNLQYTRVLYGRRPIALFLPPLVRAIAPGARFVTTFEAPGRDDSRLTRWAYRLSSLLAPGAMDPGYGFLLAGSDALIALSPEQADEIAAAAPSTRSRFRIIPWASPLDVRRGLSRQAARAELGLPASDRLLLFYGFVYPSKGIETLLQALARVKAVDPRARLVVLGGAENVANRVVGRPKYVQDLLALAESLEVSGAVTWTDFVDDSSTISTYFCAADACVLPFADGATVNRSSIAAAVAHGTPIITTARPPRPDPAFVHRQTAMLAEPGDADALAVAILDVLRDGRLREALAEGSRSLQRIFNWEAVVEQTLAAFEGGRQT